MCFLLREIPDEFPCAVPCSVQNGVLAFDLCTLRTVGTVHVVHQQNDRVLRFGLISLPGEATVQRIIQIRGTDSLIEPNPMNGIAFPLPKRFQGCRCIANLLVSLWVKRLGNVAQLSKKLRIKAVRIIAVPVPRPNNVSRIELCVMEYARFLIVP